MPESSNLWGNLCSWRKIWVIVFIAIIIAKVYVSYVFTEGSLIVSGRTFQLEDDNQTYIPRNGQQDFKRTLLLAKLLKNSAPHRSIFEKPSQEIPKETNTSTGLNSVNRTDQTNISSLKLDTRKDSLTDLKSRNSTSQSNSSVENLSKRNRTKTSLDNIAAEHQAENHAQEIKNQPETSKRLWKTNPPPHVPNSIPVYNSILEFPIRANQRLPNITYVCEPLFDPKRKDYANRTKDYKVKYKDDKMKALNYSELTKNGRACDNFKRSRGYFTKATSVEERDFPIAYSILMYTDVERMERLIRAIYQPQNVICVHIDAAARPEVKSQVEAIVGCFDNIIIATPAVKVIWGYISIIQAELTCMKQLLKYRWKYFINLSGQMFPLHTNRELVSILKLYDGANDVEGSYKRDGWYRGRHETSWIMSENGKHLKNTDIKKPPPPYNVTIYKGSNQLVATKEFIVYLLHNRKAKAILKYFNDTLIPDEYIYSTINHNPQLGAPGGYKDDPENKTFTARATVWADYSNQINWSWKHWECKGRWVREICIFGIGDLPFLHSRPELFANKFFADFEWLAYECLEDLIYQRTKMGHVMPVHNEYYKNLEFVKYKHERVNLPKTTKAPDPKLLELKDIILS